MDQNSQPMPVSNPQVAPTPQPATNATDPGKTLAIVGIVLAFVMSLAGLIVSIIAQKKSKAAGFDGNLAKIGIILNAVMLAIGLLMTLVLLAISISTYSSIQQRAQDTQQRTNDAYQRKLDEARLIDPNYQP